jgi:actin related protein 2/3 complex subunit 1A/1B
MTTINRLATSISAHAWNGAGDVLAICPNTHEIELYSYDGSSFALMETLTDHDAIVTSLAWAPNTNRILSCSQDRNAYVWEHDGTNWNPTLVILRINRAATCCQWSPKEDKFAVGTGDCVVAVCYFEADNNWWVSKHIKKDITSTILAISWHPNNILLAAGGSDKELKVFSGFVKQCDNRKDIADGTAFGKKLPFGACVEQIPMNAWILDVQFSPSGNQLAWSCHDSSLHVMNCETESRSTQSFNHNFLPFRSLQWLSERSFVAAGFDCYPVLVQDNGGWAPVKSIDNLQKSSGGNKNARSMWEDRTARGEEVSESTELSSRHQNAISVLTLRQDGSLSSSGLDGNVIVWALNAQAREAGVTF